MAILFRDFFTVAMYDTTKREMERQWMRQKSVHPYREESVSFPKAGARNVLILEGEPAGQ